MDGDKGLGDGEISFFFFFFKSRTGPLISRIINNSNREDETERSREKFKDVLIVTVKKKVIQNWTNFELIDSDGIIIYILYMYRTTVTE